MSDISLSPSFTLLSLLLNSELIRWIATEIAQFWRMTRFDGTYTVDNHLATLEILDSQGAISIYSKRQTVTFTQDGIFAIQDQAWGDGDIFAEYKCYPGVAVDRYKEGYRWKILISLQTTKNKGDRETFVIERTIKNGFTTPVGNFQTQLDHPHQKLTVSVVFPAARLPTKVRLIEQNRKRSYLLDERNQTPLSQGRMQYSYQVNRPRLYEGYILRWEW